MQAGETKLQPMLEGTKQYLVPLFQRPYSWDAKEWKILWADLADLCDVGDSPPSLHGVHRNNANGLGSRGRQQVPSH